MLEDTELSCVRSLSLGGGSRCLGTAWVCSDGGQVWGHFRLLAEQAPGGGGSPSRGTLLQAGGSLTVTGPTSAVVIPRDSCRRGGKDVYRLLMWPQPTTAGSEPKSDSAGPGQGSGVRGDEPC